jgi:aspartate kinase
VTPPTAPLRLAVVKIGGSVLSGAASYRRAAGFIAARAAAHPDERIIAVVSAEYGTTDSLLAAAREISPEPDPAALDLLWSTGELRSVALLVLSLHALGIRAASANVHQTGLIEPDERADAGRTELRPLRLRALAADHDVIVAPGFLARGVADGVVSLGRGGSDLTAVLLAAGLGADTCELVKDVPGYFSSDPNRDPDARHISDIPYSRALQMADEGCDLVQRQALVAARDRNLRVVVRAIDESRHTVIGGVRPRFSEAAAGPSSESRDLTP